MPLEVQTRHHPYGSSLSLTSAVAARIGTDRVAVYADGSGKTDVRVNGQQLTLNTDGSLVRALADGGTLTLKGSVTLVVWKDGSNLTVWSFAGYGGVQNAVLQLHPRHKGRTVGLGGNYNGLPGDDLTMRNGTVLPTAFSADQLYNQFGKSWRITDAESLFDYASGQNTATFTDLVFPLGTPAPVITPAAQAAAEAKCRAAGVTDADLIQGCAYDVAVTGDAGFAGKTAQSDIKPIAPPPVLVPSITITGTDNQPLHVGQTRTYTATVLNTQEPVSWRDPGLGATLTRTPGNPNVVTFRADLPGCYILYAGLGNEDSFRFLSNYIYLAVDKNDCFPT